MPIHGHAVHFGTAPAGGLASLVVGGGIETVLSIVTALPEIGVAATVIVPAGGDFNDDLVDLGAPALRARLAPLVRPPGGRGEGRGG